MPKISAPTVAEHRRLQRAALVAAAGELLASGGLAAVSAAAVTTKAGLARTSFYEYFPTRDAALAAVAHEAFEEWGHEVEAAIERATDPWDRLDRYVAVTMRLAADGRHDIASTLQQTELPQVVRDEISTMHDLLIAPLVRVLTGLGVGANVGDGAARRSELETAGALVQGVLGSGIRLIDGGADPGEVSRRISALLRGGLAVGG